MSKEKFGRVWAVQLTGGKESACVIQVWKEFDQPIKCVHNSFRGDRNTYTVGSSWINKSS